MLFAIIKNNIHIGNVSANNKELALIKYLQDANISTCKEIIKKYKVIVAKKYIHF